MRALPNQDESIAPINNPNDNPSAKCRILVLSNYSPYLINFRGEMMKSFIALGYEVHVAAPELTSEIHGRLTAMGCVPHEISLNRQGINPIKDASFLWQVYWLMKKIKPDVFFGYTIKPVIYGNLAAWTARVPKRCSLITGLGFSFSDEGGGGKAFIKKIAKSLYKFALGRTNYVLFQNSDDLALFRRLGLINQQKIGVVNGSGVDLSYFAPVDLPERPVFLLIARLVIEKGIREFIAAAKIVKKKNPESRFLIVGQFESGPSAISKRDFDHLIAESPVEYCGAVDDVRPSIESSSIFVLPSYREGTPRTVLEAMAMGRPIITCDTPGCRETVENGVNGFLVPAKSIGELADAMMQLGVDDILRTEMGEKGIQMAKERFDVKKVNKSIIHYMELD